MTQENTRPEQDDPILEEAAAEAAVELPSREAMTLIDTGGMLSGAGSDLLGGGTGAEGGLLGGATQPAAGSTQPVGPTSQWAGQSATQLSDVAGDAATDAAADAPTTQTYQPSVSDVARS